jgi:hypothetical protein
MHIFISYRRKDTEAAQMSSLVFKHLAEKFGEQSVFIDIDSLPAGLDFRQAIERELNFTDLFISLIGSEWLEILKANENEVDYVRDEIKYALKKNIPIVPVLVGEKVSMPQESQLPGSISSLSFFNAFKFDESHIEDNLESLSGHLLLLYSRFEVKADLFGNYIKFPRLINKIDDKFREDLEARAHRPDASAEDLFAYGKYVRDICFHHTEWGMALDIFQKSAKKGFIPAMYVLGNEYEKGYADPFLEGKEQLEFIEETIDFKQAAFWYKKAAEAMFEKKRNL